LSATLVTRAADLFAEAVLVVAPDGKLQ